MSDGMRTTMPHLVPSEALNTDCNNCVLVSREASVIGMAGESVIGKAGEDIQSKVDSIKLGLSSRYDQSARM